MLTSISSSDPPEVDDLRALIPPVSELIRDYDAKWTWDELKQMVACGDLLPIKRQPELRTRYRIWYDKVVARHGSVGDYIVNVRLGWGDAIESTEPIRYFTADCPSDQWTVFPNDWRYAVPGDVEHLVVWTRRPIIDPAILPLQFHPGGIWGVTGCEGEKLSGNADAELQELVERAAKEMNEFVKRHWPEDTYQTIWFVNPTVKQSIPGIAHIHLFVKRTASPSLQHEATSSIGET